MRARRGAVVLGAAATAGGLALLVARRMLLSVTVVGESMVPTYHDGERLLVRRSARARVGQVVVLDNRPPGAARGRADCPELLVKRLAALPGDPVPEQVLAAVGAAPGARVPRGSIVVLGDGPGSTDSRNWGYLAAERLVGVAVPGR